MIFWNHAIEFPDGTVTEGENPLRINKEFFDSIPFEGKRVLDIGTSNGFHSFYAEKRGAREVVSIDICDEQFGEQHFEEKDWRFWCQGYLEAHKKLNSRCKYIFPYSVYDLNEEQFGKFDIVLFLGVLYHLVHPALALERINQIMEKGSLLIVDSEITAMMGTFFHGDTIYNNDKTNFWIIRNEDLRRLLEFSGFRLIKTYHRAMTRTGLLLEKEREIDPKYSFKSIYQQEQSRVTNF